MKINKLFLGLAVAFMGVLTSCNSDVEGAFYPNAEIFDNVSFTSDESAEITTDEETVTVDVIVNRAKKKGALTAHYTTEASEDGIFTDDGNGVIEFADGQATAVIKVTASNMAKGADYIYTLKLSDDEILERDTVLENQISQTTVIVHSDYNWLDAGYCTFIDYTFAEGETGELAKEVPILNAEGTNLYRIIHPWAAVYGEGVDDTNVEFTYNEGDGSIGLVHSGGYVAEVALGGSVYDFMWVDKYVGSYCKIQYSGNIYMASMLGLVDGDGYYTGFSFAFQWVKGWPGEK